MYFSNGTCFISTTLNNNIIKAYETPPTSTDKKVVVMDGLIDLESMTMVAIIVVLMIGINIMYLKSIMRFTFKADFKFRTTIKKYVNRVDIAAPCMLMNGILSNTKLNTNFTSKPIYICFTGVFS